MFKLFGKKKTKVQPDNTVSRPAYVQDSEPVSAPDPVPEPVPDPAPIPTHTPTIAKTERKVIYKTVFKVAGVTYKCKKDKEENRQDVLSGLSDGDFLLLEEYTYRGESAYLVVDYHSDLDIGNVPAPIAEKINNEYYGRTTEAEVYEIDSFYPDDKDEEIYYCKVQLKIYE